MAPKKQKSEKKNIDKTTNIEPGMVVEATKGDLGEGDVSKPKVTEVVQDQQGKVDKLLVQKGVIFKKTLEIPADRIASINQECSVDESVPGKVIVNVSKKEVESLKAVGVEAFDSEQQHDLHDKVEQEVPTAEGLRELEASNKGLRKQNRDMPAQEMRSRTRSQARKTISSCVFSAHVFLAGMAGNDASAVATYTFDGATTGYGHLWLLLHSTSLYQAARLACAKVGRITQ